jgi:hypothetical protein
VFLEEFLAESNLWKSHQRTNNSMPEKIWSVILQQDPIERQDNVNNILMTHANLSDYLLLYFKKVDFNKSHLCKFILRSIKALIQFLFAFFYKALIWRKTRSTSI